MMNKSTKSIFALENDREIEQMQDDPDRDLSHSQRTELSLLGAELTQLGEISEGEDRIVFNKTQPIDVNKPFTEKFMLTNTGSDKIKLKLMYFRDEEVHNVTFSPEDRTLLNSYLFLKSFHHFILHSDYLTWKI